MADNPPQGGNDPDPEVVEENQRQPALAGNAEEAAQANQQRRQQANPPVPDLLNNLIAAAAVAANPFNQQGQQHGQNAGQPQGGTNNAANLLGQLLAHPQGMNLLGQLITGATNPNATNPTTHTPQYGAFPSTSGTTPIDIGTSYGIKQYSKAVDSLYSSGEDKFDLQPARLLNFIERIQTRALEAGWTIIFQVQNSARNNATDDFLQLHGKISIEDV
ncbi:unnamed protein product [Cylindrotheca closterium]|uniref:Uncharacterized protein n=1 Tax=Cylindrotheca closterium TaxID=2856 RepID=A0AAD2CJP9_9STRA|nr:unnamed protein product [Cylindrotheca closterium]